MAGRLREVEAEFRGGELTALRIEGEGPFEVDCGDGVRLEQARAVRGVAARNQARRSLFGHDALRVYDLADLENRRIVPLKN